MKNFIKQLREKKKITIKELSEILGMSYQNARDIDNNKVILSSKYFEKLCKLFDCSVGELFGENPVPNINIIKLKFYDNHNLLLDLDNNNYTLLSITREMLKFYRISDTFGIIGIKAWEDNMKPIIFHDDFLLIDILNKEITHKSIYVLKEKIFNGEKFEEKIRIKKILFENPFNPTVVVKSLETIAGDYPPYEVKLEEISKMIIGKVVYCGKLIN